MFKFILLALLAAVVWWALRREERRPTKDASPERPVEQMVACAHCGVYLPLSDSLAEDGRHYCCQAHRQAGPGAPGR